MTITERINKLRHYIVWLGCKVSGSACIGDECSTQYGAGTMGEVIENLEAISKILEQKVSQENALNAIKEELTDTGAFEQEVHGQTDFLKGINYCLTVINKHSSKGGNHETN